MSEAVLECPQVETVQPDWHLAQLLHSQGLSHASIVERCKVSFASLSKRIDREGWVQKREDLKRTLSVKVSSPQAERNESTLAPLSQASITVRRIVSDELLSLGLGLGKVKQPKSLQGIEGRLDVLTKYVGVAKPTYGWDQQGASSVLSVQRLEGAGESKVMDVQSQAVPAPAGTEQACLTDQPEQGKTG